MKEGSYAVRFSADGHAADGHLAYKKKLLLGTSGGYKFSGQIVERGEELIGNVLIIRDPGVPIKTLVPERYLVPVTGRVVAERFTLIGRGPLGIVVELQCTWQSEYVDGLSTP